MTELDYVTNMFVLAQEMDNKFGQELEKLIIVAVKYQEKLKPIVKQIRLRWM